MNRADPLSVRPTSSDPSEASKRLLPWLVAVAFFMESLDTTILNTAVPTISSALGVAPLSMSQIGLSAGTIVVIGGHDQPCGGLGVGAIGPGRIADSMGTYECLLAASDQPSLTDAALAASLNSYCHVVPDKFVTLAYFPSGIMISGSTICYTGVFAVKTCSQRARIHRPRSLSVTQHWNGRHRRVEQVYTSLPI
jgi:MFS family permease